MNKRKLLLIALCMTSVTACAYGITACNNDKTAEHEHTYSATWSYDDDSHYHACTDEDCTSIKDDAQHNTDGEDGACSVCGYKATPATHTHSWSKWTVTDENKPTATAEGKATRTCSGSGECDGETEEKEHVLPALTSEDYSKSVDTATCSAAGKITYTYNKDGVSVSFDVATPVKTDAHKYGNYTYTDGTGHYKVCEHNPDHKTAVEEHDTDGENGSCSVCGYNATVTPPEPEEKDIKGEGSVTVEIGGGKSVTVNAYAGAAGYYIYSYTGNKSITVTYDYYTMGGGIVTDTVTLSAAGTTSFVAVLEPRATCRLIISSTEATSFNATITATLSLTDPRPAPALDLGTNTVKATYEGKVYEFTATAGGSYTLACTDSNATIYLNSDGSAQALTLPYTFTLAANGKISFIMCCDDIDDPEQSYEVIIAEATVTPSEHSHSWGAWTVTEENKPTLSGKGKATRTCSGTGTCNATLAEKEYELPALTSEDYEITNVNAGTATYTYNKNGVEVSFTAVVAAELQDFTITVTGATEGVTVKLGDYTGTTNAQGIATVKAEKQSYDVIIENTVLVESTRKSYSFVAAQVTVANPTATVTLPTYIKAKAVSGTYFNETDAITADGLYFFNISNASNTFINIMNTTETTKKYTITILDECSVYPKDGDLGNNVSEPFDVYIIGKDQNRVIGSAQGIISQNGSSAVAVIKVTSVDYADGTVYTPIPVGLDEQIALNANTLYYSPDVDTNCMVNFTVSDGTVVWYGNDKYSTGTTLSGNYFIDKNEKYYFTAMGTGTLSFTRVYVDGENKPNAITLTKGTEEQVELGTLGGITDNVRWFKFTGVNTNTGYLTVASENVSLVVYEGSTVIANEDISVLPIAVTAGTEYFVRVLYKGQYDEETNTATLTILLRDYKDTDALAVDNGQDKENPYILQADTQDENYANRKNGEVSFLWGSATNSERYLVFTATEEGELQFTGVRAGNVTLYSDAAFSTALASDKYTKVGSANGDICTVPMVVGDTVYIKITGVTTRNVKATLSYTKNVPVDYTVVVKDGADNLVNGVSVELWNTDGKVGDAVTTNAQGEAVFSQITAGEYTIKILSDDYSYDNVVTIEKSYVDCTTEVSVTALVNYTVTLKLPEGVEASEFDGVTVTLKGTEATGELQNGTVTFSQKVKPGVYQIIIEKDGYNVTGSTSKTETQAMVKVVSDDVNLATGCGFVDALNKQTPGGSGLAVGENLLSQTGSNNIYGWFKADSAGNYTFTVNDDDLWISSLTFNGYMTQLVGGGTLVANGIIVSSDTKTVGDSGEKVYTITLTLTETDIVYIAASNANATASITITKEA